MTTRKYSSRSQQTTLTAALTSSGTSATVVSGTALLGGVTISAGETFTVVIDPDTALEEIVDVTAVSTNTLTLTRGVDGSTGQAHSAGAVVRHMAIGRDYREANQHIENTTTAHGLTIANVLETTDTNMITTAMLQSNSVTTAKITDLNITTGKIADSAITSAKIADGTIATGDIADSAITTGKIAAEAVTTAKIPESAITNSRIAADAVTADKIAADAVGTSEIANLAVTTGKLADSAVTSAKIADGTIVAGDIADGAITSAKILDGTIVAGDIADGAITSAKILDGTIENADVSATAAIAKTKLNLGGTITSADLVDGTIVASDIADGTITAAKMVTDPYARANHTGTQTASTISNFDTQVRTSRLDQMAAPTGSLSMNTQKITNVVDPTSAQDASTKAYVDAQVNALVNGAPGTLDTLKEIADAISDGGSFASTVVLKSGSTMTGALVLNADPSNSLGAATKQYVDAVAGSATAAAASAAAAATTYDNFDDRYLGAKSSAPSVDNDGNALITGALYWNSVSATMFAWTGSAWGSISSTADIYRYRYTAAGGETSESGPDDNGLTLSYIVGKEQVYLNGVLLVRSTDYVATNGTSITSLAALTAGDILEVITFTAFDLANVISPTVIDAKGDLIAGVSADTIGKLTVGTNGQVLKANSATATGLEWGELDDTNAIQNAIVDAKGDIVAASADNTPARLGVGSDGQLLTADSTSATGLSYQNNWAAGKNKIINGDFRFNQRNVTSTTTNDAFIFDRWSMVGVGGTTTTTSESFTPGTAPVAGYEGNKFIKQVISGQTLQSQYAAIRQKIEDVRTFANQTVTFSFWAKADSGTPYLWVEWQQYFGTGGSPSATPVAQLGSTITLNTSWTRYSVTGTIPSIAGKTIGTDANSSALQMLIWTSLGSSIRAYTNATFQNAGISVWGVQVEAGSTATAFQTATGTIQGELAACQRYYYRLNLSTGKNFGSGMTSTTQGSLILNFPVTMRTSPTALEQSGTAADYSLLTAIGTVTAANAVPTFQTATDINSRITITTAGGLTNNSAAIGRSAAATAYLGWSAEL